MPQETFRLGPRGMLFASIAAAFPLASQAAPVARVDFAVGNVTAVAPSGQTRPLAKGAQVEEGETVNTNTGRAQLRFVDGAYVSLQPESEFRIDQYRYAGREDGSENAVLSLFKGGLRTITGFIGRTNKRNYQVTTSVATIGIRGTEYTIQYGDSISGTVGEGIIEVCNGAGCATVSDGESYYVRDENTRPELSNKGTDLPPAAPESPPSSFAQGENVDAAGSTNIFVMVGDRIVSGAFVGALSRPTADSGFQVTFDSSGALVGFDSVTDVGNDGIIAWGRGTSSGGTQVEECLNCLALVETSLISLSSDPWTHYVVGLPTTSSDLDNLAISQPVATYVLVGGTSPTAFDSSTGTLLTGTLTGGYLTADFANFLVGASVSMTIASQSITATESGMQISPEDGIFSGGEGCSVGGAAGSCSMAGFFSGVNAIRAGVAYELSLGTERESPLDIHGTAAFSKLP
jgi:hypothetical protein